MASSDDTVYKIKYIKYPPTAESSDGGGETEVVQSLTPIILQNVNGPCPMLSIANILLLRGAISLPENVGEVSQDRIIALVADRLLQTSLDSVNKATDEEYSANIQANLDSAIALLPKLTTGIDVNVRFHDIRGFEFTNETTIFDLLNMDLVHAWLVDPQDTATASALGQKSYNEIVTDLVTELGGDEVARCGSSGTATGGGVTFNTLGGVSPFTAAPSGEQKPAAGSEQQQQQPIDAKALAAALENSLQIVTARQDTLDTLPTTTSSNPIPVDSVTMTINKLLGEVVQDAFQPAAAAGTNLSSTATEEQQQQQQGPRNESPLITLEEGVESAKTDNQQQQQEESPVQTTTMQLPTSSQPATPPPSAASASAADLDVFSGSNTSVLAPSSSLVPLASDVEAPLEDTNEQVPTSSSLLSPASSQVNSPTINTTDKQQDKETSLRNTLLCREFLDTNPSQLTYYGLSALHEGLNDGQLAVFFRNNHFNVLHKFGGRLYILITDEGYRFEPDVVWEKLIGVDGDNELVDANLRAFKPHVSDSINNGSGGGFTGAVSSALSSVGIGSNTTQPNMPTYQQHGIVGGYNAQETAPQSIDADFALAMQLQKEEEERAARLAQQQQQGGSSHHSASSHNSGRMNPSGYGQGPPPMYQQQGGGVQSPQRPKKEKKSDCVIM